MGAQMTHETLRLPVTPAEVTKDWLTRALAINYPGIAVKSLLIDEANALWGTATKLPVQVEYNDKGKEYGLPDRLLIKGGFAAHRELMEPVYRQEARFYRELGPKLGITIPQHYFSGDDEESKQHIVVMEDLNLRDVAFCRVQNPLDFQQTASFLDSMARFHAKWWESSALEPEGEIGWLARWDPLAENFLPGYVRNLLKPEVWSEQMRRPRGVAVPKCFHDGKRMLQALLNLRTLSRADANCFLHSDFHLGNLYLEADGKAGIFDWQSFHIGPWSHDVTYFMLSALDIADRPRWDKALLAYYLGRLAVYGVTHLPTFDDAWDAIRRQAVYGLFWWLQNPVEWQAEENNCAVAPRFAAAALEYGTYDMLGVT